jgi:hypothetical protein
VADEHFERARRQAAANVIRDYQRRNWVVCEHTMLVDFRGCADAVVAALDNHDQTEVERLRAELRKAAAYLFRRADLDADLSPSESRALAAELRDVAALDQAEATP